MKVNINDFMRKVRRIPQDLIDKSKDELISSYPRFAYENYNKSSGRNELVPAFRAEYYKN